MRSRWIASLAGWYQARQEKAKHERFIRSGCIPWTEGYTAYKRRVLQGALGDRNLLSRFTEQQDLPPGFGYRVDERIVEVPWVLARLREEPRVLLDAGASLNHDFLLQLAALRMRRIFVCGVSREKRLGGANVSYVGSDLRCTGLKAGEFDEIVCISTLEHIGMDNTRVYSRDVRFKQFRPDDYKLAVREFHRLLRPGGRLLLTVPYGRYENHGWLQQFNRERLESIFQVFGGTAGTVAFYKYFEDGWQLVGADACGDCRYFDIQSRTDHEPDYVAAARAVACIELVRD